MDENKLLLSTAYFAPVHYYARFVKHQVVCIEHFENFNKQTYRNRCVILGANGPLSLVVPVVKGRGRKILISDLRVSYDEDWQKDHWRAISSAYNSSPFFEYYMHDIDNIFHRKWKYIIDLNREIHNTVCELLEIENKSVFTHKFENSLVNTLDLRDVISPKNKTTKDAAFKPATYTQVFSEKFGFVPNMSILDLLFNEGPNSFTLLDSSLRNNDED